MSLYNDKNHFIINGGIINIRMFWWRPSLDSSVDKQERINRFGEDKSTTKEDVIKRHGKPYKIETKCENEYWHYKTGTKFKGFLVIFLIEIPLVLPTGEKERIIKFSDEKEIGEEWDVQVYDKIYCSPIPIMWLGHKSINAFCSK